MNRIGFEHTNRTLCRFQVDQNFNTVRDESVETIGLDLRSMIGYDRENAKRGCAIFSKHRTKK